MCRLAMFLLLCFMYVINFFCFTSLRITVLYFMWRTVKMPDNRGEDKGAWELSREPATPKCHRQPLKREWSSSQNMTLINSLYRQIVFANVNSRSRSLYAIARPSSVWNVRAPYSAGWNFWQYSFAIWYLGHPLTSTEKLTEIVPREPLRWGVKRKRGSEI